jgi:hypothetical protein
MPATGVRHILPLRESQGPTLGGSQAQTSGETQMPLFGESQGPDLRESQMPHEWDFMTLGLDQSSPDSPHDMLSDDDQQPPPKEGVDEEHADDPAHTD